MEDENNILFVRGTFKNTTDTSVDDVWDDSALIKAYDKAITLAKDEVTRRMGMDIETVEEKSTNLSNDKKTHDRHKPSRKWTVGSPCRAVYSTDGEIYEAIVAKVYENTGACIVKFVGYGNTEKVKLSSLLESDGLRSQIAQQKRATDVAEDETARGDESTFDGQRTNGPSGERMDYELENPKLPENVVGSATSFNSTYGIMPPPPPIPPQLIAKLPENDSDALSSMLMSWYISGFHTGYYHGIKQKRNSEDKRNK